jgi:hypothetical protein
MAALSLSRGCLSTPLQRLALGKIFSLHRLQLFANCSSRARRVSATITKNLHTAVGGLIQLGSTLRHGVAIIGVGEVDDACELAVFSPAVEMR